MTCLEGHAEPQSEAPTVTAVVLDGAVIVQMLKLGIAKAFEEYAHRKCSSHTLYDSSNMYHVLTLCGTATEQIP